MSDYSSERKNGRGGYDRDEDMVKEEDRVKRESRSRSRTPGSGRSRSRSRSRDGGRDNLARASLRITDEDAAFILGRGGKTKSKIGRVSGASLNLENSTLEISGTKEAVERAKSYCEMVMAQRVGPVKLPDDMDTRGDLTVLEVPSDCVGYVTGRKGMVLRNIEEEFGTIMFFAEVTTERGGRGRTEKLAIFGTERNRRGAELKVMSAVEQKSPGWFTEDLSDKYDSSDGFGTDIFHIKEEDYSYALGKEGSTRVKLGRAAGALMEYVGRFAYISGTKAERTRCLDYLKWLCQQRTGAVSVETEGRSVGRSVCRVDRCGLIQGSVFHCMAMLHDFLRTLVV